jgi:hypothetical protein
VRLNYFSYLIGLALLAGYPTYRQFISSGTVAGTVADPSGAVIADAAVQLRNPVTGYEQTLKTDSAGAFRFNNIPQNSYRLTATAAGFASATQEVDVHGSLPITVNITLKVAAEVTQVDVQAS